MKKYGRCGTPPNQGVRSMKNFFAKVLFVLFAAALMFSCAKKSDKIIIGTGQNYEPNCYRDADGNLAGFDIEVVKEIDKRLPQYTFEFEIFEFKNVLVSLAAGKIDVGAHEFEENPERRKTYLYGEEGYNDFDSYLTIKADGPWSHIGSLEDLAGNPDAVIGVSTGSNHEAFVRTWNETHPKEEQINYTLYEGTGVGIANIANGTYAAQLMTPFDLGFNNAKVKDLNLKFASDKPVITSKAYFLFKKDNVTLQQAFDGALREMKADGTLDAIRDRIYTEYFNSL
jgi:L-cystine transport system substrate-binding protein